MGIIKSLKTRLFYKFLPKYLKYLNQREFDKSEKLPKFELEYKHLKNARLIPNRIDLLNYFPKNGVLAEIGVNRGDFSEQIFNICNPSKLHLIDAWSFNDYPSELEKHVIQRFKKEILVGIIEINKGLSPEVLNEFPDNYFDCVYIDTDHSYLTTKNELEICSKKIKIDGLISGHDFSKGQWENRIRFGVVEAVHEFCFEKDWEILYLTHEVNRQLSYTIRKINKGTFEG